MDLGPHANFILLAYAAAAFVLGALVIWVVADHRMQLQAIELLEAKGVSRRSGARAV
jgi:heme exporter protein D